MSAEEVTEAFDRIAKDIRSGYTLAYAPTTSASSGDEDGARRRKVRVYVRSKDGRGLRVRTRDGYFEKTRGAAQ